MPAEFDIIVFGATGFTGRLVAEYLATRYGSGSDVNWAMAGRSLDKLAAVRNEIKAPAGTQLIVADGTDPASLDAMAARTKAVLTTVGPYQLYGSELVAACTRAGTGYLDLCGEPAWMRKMIDAHHAAAQTSGARIVFSCGFDSIPFELGVFFLQETAKAQLGKTASRVKAFVRKMRGTASGGTAASLLATMAAAVKDPGVRALLSNPFALTPGFEGPKQPHGLLPKYDPDVGSWVAPFVMAQINTRNVHRSNALMGHPYGADFVYDEMIVAGTQAAATAIAGAISSIARLTGLKPGDGPSKEEREAGFYDILFVGLTPEGKQVRASVSGDRDPGYGSTSKMIAESAICLVRDATDTPGGVWTPGAAMGRRLIDRLVANAGLTFQMESK